MEVNDEEVSLCVLTCHSSHQLGRVVESRAGRLSLLSRRNQTIQSEPQDPQGLHVNHLRFAKHLDYLQRHYHVISLNDYLLANLKQSSLPKYCVVLTFDDGFRNFVTAAAPLLG